MSREEADKGADVKFTHGVEDDAGENRADGVRDDGCRYNCFGIIFADSRKDGESHLVKKRYYFDLHMSP